MKRMLFGGLVGLAIGLPLAFAGADDAGYANPHLLVEPDDLARMIAGRESAVAAGLPDDLRIVDVRPREAFGEGHLPGAISLPYTELTDSASPVAGALKPLEDIAEQLGSAGIDASSRVVIYDDQGGFRAARLFWVLEYMGHRSVALLNGDIRAWTDAKSRLETGRNHEITAVGSGKASTPARFPLTLTPRRHASADWLLERADDPDTVVVDVRQEAMYEKGHIPWALNLPWKGNLDDIGRMKSAGALRDHFEAAGVTPDRNVAIHCQTGEASAHSYFALRLLGYPRVRVYHRSWAEWGSADDLPRYPAS